MKYHFVTLLENLKIDSTFSKGKKVDEMARISNGFSNFEQIFMNEVFIKGIGFLEYNSFENSVYIYQIGNQKDINEKLSRIEQLNYLMRKTQMFLLSLWLVKDNSVNIGTGFLQVYDKHPSAGSVTSNALIDSPTNSNGEYCDVSFSSEELDLAIKYFKMINFDVNEDTLAGGRLPVNNPLSKESGRVGRAFYFLMTARNESTLPIKVIHYCTFLECLFTSDSQEVTHKVSERFAYFLGNDTNERKSFYKLAKDLYKIRSKAVHGQPVKETAENMKTALINIDSAARKILVSCLSKDETSSVFSFNNEEYEKWFIDLILD